MAVSDTKSKTLTAYSIGDGTFILTATFEEQTLNDEDILNNRSRVNVVATLACDTGSFDVYNAGDLKIYWYDNNTNSSGYLADTLNISTLMSGSKSASATIQVAHKADGTVSGYAKAEWKQNRTDYGYYPASGDISTDQKALTTIDRYATVTTSTSNITETSVAVSWLSDVSVDQVRYRLNNGSWVDVEEDVDKTSGTYTIINLLPSTTYRIDFDYKRKDSQQWSYAAGYSGYLEIITLDYINYIKINNIWKKAIPYIKVSGSWKKAIPYIKVSGSWKEGIN